MKSIRLSFALWLVGVAALAQEPEPAQDSKLDNLVHDAGYKTAELGSLGAEVDAMVAGFLERNAH